MTVFLTKKIRSFLTKNDPKKPVVFSKSPKKQNIYVHNLPLHLPFYYLFINLVINTLDSNYYLSINLVINIPDSNYYCFIYYHSKKLVPDSINYFFTY